MQTIEFLRNYTVQAEGGVTWSKGEIAKVPDASARHYFDRGVARPYVPPPEPEPPEAEQQTPRRGPGRPRKADADVSGTEVAGADP